MIVLPACEPSARCLALAQDELLGLQERDGPRATASQIDLGTVYRAGETPQVRGGRPASVC